MPLGFELLNGFSLLFAATADGARLVFQCRFGGFAGRSGRAGGFRGRSDAAGGCAFLERLEALDGGSPGG